MKNENFAARKIRLIILSSVLFISSCGKSNVAPPSLQTSPLGDTPIAAPEAVPATSEVHLQSLKCPEAPRQLDKDIIIDAKGRIEGLAALTGASIEGKVSAITQDFISKYPNADKLLVAQMLMSVTCETLKVSPSIQDSERLERINNVNTQIMKMFTSEAAPDFRSRAKHADFGKVMDGITHRKIFVSNTRAPTLYIFDPECKVRIFVSSIFPPGGDPHWVSFSDKGMPLYASANETFRYRFKPDDPIFRNAVEWDLNDANHDLKGPGTITESIQSAARIGLKLIANKEFEADIVMMNGEGSKCDGSYYIANET